MHEATIFPRISRRGPSSWKVISNPQNGMKQLIKDIEDAMLSGAPTDIIRMCRRLFDFVSGILNKPFDTFTNQEVVKV